jgi:3-oxocholest-4-en-26-oate---CoA ligase
MEMHFATVWESIADAIPDSTAVVHGGIRRTWSQHDDRSARLAAAFDAAGLKPDSKIGLYLYNGPEYLESQYAAFKMRGVAVNVNYRYLDEELWYLLDNADAEAVVFHSSLGDRVARVVDRLPKLKLLLEVDDGNTGQVGAAQSYEAAIAATDPMPRIERAEDDIYMLYTGGTTGMPKGVMYALGAMTNGYLVSGFPLIGLAAPTDPSQVAELVKGAVESGNQIVSIPCAPLMHGAGIWLGAFIPHLAGGVVVTTENRSLDADEILGLVQSERATNTVIVGDSFAKPIIRAIDAAIERGEPYDTSSLKLMISTGVMFTSEVKEQVLERIQQMAILDAIGSTEGGMGTSITMRGMPSGTARFARMPDTKVFTEDGREVEPGSDEVGMVAAGGNIPLGYFKDPEKTARTFKVINGERYSFPGDMAKVAADGSLILLGRGSQVINTGGEKVFPEEVEEAVKRVDGVKDCLVVGLEDEKFGQSVTAVASLDEGATVDEAAVIADVKTQLAHFKAPKRVVFVAQVPRAPNGKADYKAAKDHALSALGNS